MTPEEALLLWLRRAYERGQLAVRCQAPHWNSTSGKISLSEAVAALDRVLEESNMIEASSAFDGRTHVDAHCNLPTLPP